MLRRTVVLMLLIAALLPAFTLSAYALELEDDELAIVHINVGQGAATLMLGPADSTGARTSVLIDAGRAQGGDYDGGRLVLEALNNYGVTRLDYFIASHYHADHIGGLAAGPYHGSCFLFGLDGVPGTEGDDDGDGNANWEPDGEPDLGEFGQGVNHDDVLVDTFVDRGTEIPYDSDTYRKYADVRAAVPVETVTLDNQQIVDAYEIDLGASGGPVATLTCLAANGFVRDRPDPVDNVNEEDERNLCFWLSFGNFHYLIGGDATGGGDSTAEIEQAVGHYLATLQTPVTIDVLAVNHHGSRTSSATAFLADVRPEVAVISVGDKSNSYGHPHLVALESLYEEEVETIYQTERGTTADEVPDDIEDIRVVVDGDVVITSDGESFWVPRFPDIMPYHWAFGEIEACADAGVVGGYDDGLYHPTNPVDRGQMSVFVSRALADGDENVPDFTGTPTFPDVPEGFWALDYVEYAVSQNVVGGYGDGTYHPEYEVTRDQMAVYVARSLVAPAGEAALAGYVPADPRNFLDVPNTGYGDDGTDPFWAYTHVEYCVENGVVQGYDDGYYHPEYVVTRDQMAVYIGRAFGLLD